MDLFEALLIGGVFFICWITINTIVREAKRRNKISNQWLPDDYYESEKGWWKKW